MTTKGLLDELTARPDETAGSVEERIPAAAWLTLIPGLLGTTAPAVRERDPRHTDTPRAFEVLLSQSTKA
jgi:hypothetical protein